MPQTVQSINDRLFKEADDELKKTIDALFATYQTFKNCHSVANITVATVTKEGYDNKEPSTVQPYVVIEAIKDMLFKENRDRNRQDKIDAFLSQVNDLAANVEEIRQRLEN